MALVSCGGNLHSFAAKVQRVGVARLVEDFGVGGCVDDSIFIVLQHTGGVGGGDVSGGCG